MRRVVEDVIEPVKRLLKLWGLRSPLWLERGQARDRIVDLGFDARGARVTKDLLLAGGCWGGQG